tara:strand:- start:29 stop:1222 length:1194 start_codon:yes stop_codon:yes gene_type:complete
MKLSNKSQRYTISVFIFTGFSTFIFYKALVTEITVDEAYSFLNYSYVENVFNIGIANNHLLNSYLVSLFQNFGYSEIFLRLPNVIFGWIYIALVINVSLKTKNYLFSTFLLILNPYVVDFFSISRGYGITTSLVFLSIYSYLYFKNYNLYFSIFFLIVATTSYHVTVVFLILFYVVNIKDLYQLKGKLSFLIVSFLVSLVSYWNIRVLFYITSLEKPLYGVKNLAFQDLIFGSFGLNALYIEQNIFFNIFLNIVLFLPIFSISTFDKKTLVTFIVSYGSLFSIYLIPFILGKPYPLLREVVPFLPPILLLSVISINNLYSKIKTVKPEFVSSLIIIILMFNFVNNIDINQTIDWNNRMSKKSILEIDECGYIVKYGDLDSVGQYYRFMDDREIVNTC